MQRAGTSLPARFSRETVMSTQDASVPGPTDRPRRAGKYSSGVVVVRFVDGHPRYLLLRSFRYWDFPKGGVESGETPLEAARREVLEEAGLSELDFRWGHGYTETTPYRDRKVARYYVAELVAGEPWLPVNPELGRPEHHEFRWFDYPHAHARLVPRLRAVLDWAHAIVGGPSNPSNGRDRPADH